MTLPIKALEEGTKIYDELIEVASITHEDKKYSIQFYPLFKYEKIRKLVLEIGQFFMKAKDEKVKVDQLEEDDLINYFIIKHFSKGLKFTTSKKAKTVYNEFKIFYNSDLYKVFKDEVFSNDLVEQSKQDVYKEIFANIELSAKFEKRLQEAQQLIGNLPLQNPELFQGAAKQVPEA